MIRRVRPQQRDTIPIQLPDGRNVDLLRVVDPRARRLRLLVNERGPRLTIPALASHQDAMRFVAQNLGWLQDQLTHDPKDSPVTSHLIPGQVAHIPLRGRFLPVRWEDARFLHVSVHGEQLLIGYPSHTKPAALQRALHEFYLSQARADVGRWLPKYVDGLPRPPREWRIRPLTSLWGSLSSSGSMSLDLALVLGPPAAFEYVLVHELCHLIQHNHSPAFWYEVERRLPQWREQRRWLRDEGLALKRDLRLLLS